jgi:hypothetical protein
MRLLHDGISFQMPRHLSYVWLEISSVVFSGLLKNLSVTQTLEIDDIRINSCHKVLNGRGLNKTGSYIHYSFQYCVADLFNSYCETSFCIMYKPSPVSISEFCGRMCGQF